jgi:hypothetical protein
MQAQSRISQPLRKFSDCLFVAVVKMRARREQLYFLEAMSGDVYEVIAAEPVFVEEMCGDAELIHGQLISLFEGPITQF